MKDNDKPTYRNRKTGQLYKFGFIALNATSGEGMKKMVVYLGETGTAYVREWGEFFEKFEEVKP